jgi:hypothetical protein
MEVVIEDRERRRTFNEKEAVSRREMQGYSSIEVALV